MTYQKSSYIGFINGYIAGNLEANSIELNLHNSKINELFRDLEFEISKGGYNNPTKLIDQIRRITSINTTGKVSEETYATLGDDIFSFVSLLLAENDPKQLPSQSTFLIKKIIYHYLNIAKTSKLNGIEKRGMEIADKFNSVWKQ